MRALVVALLLVAAVAPVTSDAAARATWWLPKAWGETPVGALPGPRFSQPPRAWHVAQYEAEPSRGYAFRRLAFAGWGTADAVGHGQARLCADEGFCSRWFAVRIDLGRPVRLACGRFYTRYRATGLVADVGAVHRALVRC